MNLWDRNVAFLNLREPAAPSDDPRRDVPALYDHDARYGRWNGVALVSYTIGVLAQVPFMAQAIYTGPIAEALGGADISWLVGLAVTAALYYPWAKRTTDVPAEMIYPVGTVAR